MIDEKIRKLKQNIARVIVGKQEVVDLLLTGLLAGGHILINDVPGTGKTKLVKSLARSINASFKRIQFTPDLQPADITGMYYYNQKKGDFEFRPGPIMNNIILADEINRAVPRTQSSLLEAMQEKQVTIEGEYHRLKEPFMVIATQNPVELEGTFPLPEAQLDRFFMEVAMGYPDKNEEIKIMQRFKRKSPLSDLKPVIEAEDIISLRKKVQEIEISRVLLEYIRDLSRETRQEEKIELGISPRGSLFLMQAAQAYSFVTGRKYVLPDDIKFLFPYLARHRIKLKYEHQLTGEGRDEFIEEILTRVEVPAEDIDD